VSDTPRTDEAQFGTGRVSVGFARQLELELNAANDRIKRLEREVELLRFYGNKDCTAQADEVLKKEAKP
jgi:hypothetical protein